jgi:hypothetical protein
MFFVFIVLVVCMCMCIIALCWTIKKKHVQQDAQKRGAPTDGLNEKGINIAIMSASSLPSLPSFDPPSQSSILRPVVTSPSSKTNTVPSLSPRVLTTTTATDASHASHMD